MHAEGEGQQHLIHAAYTAEADAAPVMWCEGHDDDVLSAGPDNQSIFDIFTS